MLLPIGENGSRFFVGVNRVRFGLICWCYHNNDGAGEGFLRMGRIYDLLGRGIDD